MSTHFDDDCPRCGAITAALTDHRVRFCEDCGFEIPIAVRLEAAIIDTEIEMEQGIGHQEIPKCTEGFHFEILLDHQLMVRCEPDAADELGPQPKFCPYCGKGLPEALSEEWQSKLEKMFAEIKEKNP